MGLNEQRATQDFATNTYPALEADIKAVIGEDVTVEVNWEELQKGGDVTVDNFADSWTKVFFSPLLTALKAVAIDDIGKQALAAKISHIKIEASYAREGADQWARIDGSTLILDHVPFRRQEEEAARAASLQKTLEDNL